MQKEHKEVTKKKINELDRDIITLQKKLDMLRGDADTEPYEPQDLPAMEEEGVEENVEFQTPIETLVTADAENEIFTALENPQLEQAFVTELTNVGSDAAAEVLTELNSMETTGVPNAGAKETPGNKYEYVKIFVNVLFGGIDDSYAQARGFQTAEDYKKFVIEHIEASQVLLIELGSQIARNRKLSTNLRLIAKVATM